MKLPMLTPPPTTRIMTDTFRGYSHNLKIADGEMYETQNLTTDYYPLLASRKPRKKVLDMTAPGGLIAKDKLYFVDNGTLYSLGTAQDPTAAVATSLTGLTSGEKTLVSMGAYICVFPDKKYYNTADATDYGSMEASFNLASSGAVFFADVCNLDNSRFYGRATYSNSEPSSPANGDYWVDTKNKLVKQYSEPTGAWQEVPFRIFLSLYTTNEESAANVLSQIKAGDTVTLSGAGFDVLAGDRYVYNAEQDNNRVELTISGVYYVGDLPNGTRKLSRSIPDMDFVCECQNRLWGCKYGTVDGKTVNEIYASALGSFKNWQQFEGISTDSWAASIGSDGPFTGAINYLGRPCFFKKDRVHVVTVSPEGAHRVDEIICTGVQKGSGKSLQIVGDTLYYKGENGVYAWQGGFPTLISAALGDIRYEKALAGTFDNKYYLSMKQIGEDLDSRWQMFIYDTQKGLWMRESNFRSGGFAQIGEELFAVHVDKSTNPDQFHLYALKGTVGSDIGTGVVNWSMETGLLYYEYPDRKYLSRYDIRLKLAADATAKIYIEYDSSGTWEDMGAIQHFGDGAFTGTIVVPIRPRRCDHLRMKLSGTGDVKIYSVSRTLEVGSDV